MPRTLHPKMVSVGTLRSTMHKQLHQQLKNHPAYQALSSRARFKMVANHITQRLAKMPKARKIGR